MKKGKIVFIGGALSPNGILAGLGLVEITTPSTRDKIQALLLKTKTEGSGNLKETASKIVFLIMKIQKKEKIVAVVVSKSIHPQLRELLLIKFPQQGLYLAHVGLLLPRHDLVKEGRA